MDYDCQVEMQILIVKLSAIGDVVQTLPAVEAIKKRYPESEITWVVEEAASGILKDHPAISKVLISKRKDWIRMLRRPRTFAAGLQNMAAFISELRRAHYDIAIDFQGLMKSGMLIGLARASRKIGFDRTRELSYLFLNERLPRYDLERHALDRYLDIARYLGAKDPSPGCSFPIKFEVDAMRQKLSGIRRGGQALVIINPVARWKTKLWPEKKFAELADGIVDQNKAVVIFTGSRDDRSVNDRILKMMRQRALNWAGETSLKELAALATLGDLFITTDTGPMHLAAAVGARVIALFGPTAPWRTGPYGTSQDVVRTGIACSPCFRRDCKKQVQCMTGIAVSDILSRIKL